MVDDEGERADNIRPAPGGFATWHTYWTAQGMPWRTAPEPDAARQQFLTERRAVQPDVGQGRYPFKGITLDRTDVEWLLAAHESGGWRGPVDWADERQRARAGLDLRGAWLSRTDLSGLPLARLLGGLGRRDRDHATPEQRQAAAIHLEGARLYDAHLEDAVLSDAHLEGAILGGTFNHRTHLELAKLIAAHLEGADCSYARLDGAAMRDVRLEGATLYRAHLERAELRGAQLGGATLTRTHLEGALLDQASLAGKTWSSADLDRLRAAGMRVAPELPPADLREAFFDPATSLTGITLGSPDGGYVSLADVRWNNVNLAVVDWTHMRRRYLGQRLNTIEVGDERAARTAMDRNGKRKDGPTRLREYTDAVRANRQLATALRGQSLSEAADRFAYRAQKLQRHVLRRQRRYGAMLGSWLLDAVAGYGYRPGRSVLAYLVVIGFFAGLFLVNGQFAAPHLRWDEAVVLSVSSFHGRGFFTTGISLGDTLARLAAGEAIIGLLLEITFIATFTQRFFAR